MARAGVAYPQVRTTAADLARRRVVAGRRDWDARAALDAIRESDGDVLVIGPGRAVRRRDLERVEAWGLSHLRVTDIAWSDLPVVTPATPEIKVRRLLMNGAPLIVVRDAGGGPAGAIDSEDAAVERPALSLLHRLEPPGSRAAEERLRLLRAAGAIGESMSAPVFAVGGFVRDLLLDRPAPDVDLLVEGDGIELARRLAQEIGGEIAVHREFATASIQGAGLALGRIDVASARRERYEAPGALPIVAPAPVGEDLRRRDFSVNAMAMALRPLDFGRLLDPLGGEIDLRSRRLRPLHPLSFLEDPTRIWRAARYCSRLGFAIEPRARRAVVVAVSATHYPALSGQRIRAEIDLLAGEPRGW
ncbi:MAG TPA: hypothetical protein VEL75_07960, partial [Candidatus Methylomirabilis sp.]|nr:hypothetical protein [Candidatus Methylomirabilis sp.]